MFWLQELKESQLTLGSDRIQAIPADDAELGGEPEIGWVSVVNEDDLRVIIAETKTGEEDGSIYSREWSMCQYRLQHEGLSADLSDLFCTLGVGRRPTPRPYRLVT
jgi:hypothetical protein